MEPEITGETQAAEEVTHIADVVRVTICPESWRAVCRCGKWTGYDRDQDKLRERFNAHKNETEESAG